MVCLPSGRHSKLNVSQIVLLDERSLEFKRVVDFPSRLDCLRSRKEDIYGYIASGPKYYGSMLGSTYRIR